MCSIQFYLSRIWCNTSQALSTKRGKTKSFRKKFVFFPFFWWEKRDEREKYLTERKNKKNEIKWFLNNKAKANKWKGKLLVITCYWMIFFIHSPFLQLFTPWKKNLLSLCFLCVCVSVSYRWRNYFLNFPATQKNQEQKKKKWKWKGKIKWK